MGLYITRASLEVNGTVIDDFKGVTEHARIIRKKVPLMYKSGTADITQRYEVTVEYVVPQVNPFIFDGVEGGTLTIEYDGGDSVSYGGVATAEVGEAKVDMENEVVRAIRLIAERRNGNAGNTSNP